MYPVVKTSVDPRRYEKLAPPVGFEPTPPRGAGGLARARTAWRCLDVTFMLESAEWEAYREKVRAPRAWRLCTQTLSGPQSRYFT